MFVNSDANDMVKQKKNGCLKNNRSIFWQDAVLSDSFSSQRDTDFDIE